jgi:hypothetical protein
MNFLVISEPIQSLLFRISFQSHLIKDDSRLDSALVLDRLQSLTPLLELEGLVDNAFDLDFSRIKVVDSSGYMSLVWKIYFKDLR